MSALNAFYTQDEEFAYLLTDGASFSYKDGTVASLGTKVAAFPKFKIAFAMSGPLIINHIMAYVQERKGKTQSDIMAHLSDTFREARHGMAVGKPEGESTGANDMTMLAIVYLDAEQRPAIYRVDSRPQEVSGQMPFVWHEIDGVFIPPSVSPAIEERGGWIADAINDGRDLLRAQRKYEIETLPGGVVGVGGTCTLSRVGPDGIKVCEILDFEDQIGVRASVSNSGVDALRPI